MTPRSRQRLFGRAIAILVLGALSTIAASCSLGQGKGDVSGDLNIPDCWAGQFNLNPDFFAAVPYRSQLILRIQRGGDYQNFSDGLSILIDDVPKILKSALSQPLQVSLPPEVTPPGIPIKAVPNPPIVHATLYLQRSCRVQNVALYAVDQVTLNSRGECADEPSDAGAPTTVGQSACTATGLVSDAGAAGNGGIAQGTDASLADAGGQDGAAPAATGNVSGQSWISFRNLFDGNPDESDASKRLTDADFEFFLADPREVCPGGFGPPPPCRGHIKGTFKFYFERGRPAQPFP